ncbi:MAG: glycoside hydrolase family 44 protein [Anaerolineales bacterium]
MKSKRFGLALTLFATLLSFTGLTTPITSADANLILYSDLATTAGPTLSVNVALDRKPISPYIYGMNFADEALANELDLPVRRWGGNSTTRYNWQNDTDNRASDYFFQNIPNPNSNVGALPTGSASDKFVEQDRRTATETIMTIPMIGWVAKRRTSGHPYDCGFSIVKYGAQQASDPYDPDCGNGILANGTPITGNDPTDTSIAIGPSFVQQWVQHLVGRFGAAANGGVQFYNLDNEPMLWNSTHRDIHPQPTSYDEMVTRTVQYAGAIKQADPTALTLGPVLWGWTAYWYSAADAAGGGAWWNTRPDRMAHGDVPFAQWYLQQMRAYEQANSTRLLDCFDLHYYPQASGVALSPAGDANTQALRLRSTRSLWDATYADESWINGTEGGPAVRLIPRMREWVNTHYPGTRLAITEYNWGALDHLNGALAQADVLGIFGREGLDLATLWDPPTSAQPGAFAFRMYRNYDGTGSKFGETSIHATSSDQSTLAIYAAQRSSDQALTLIIINKTSTAQTSTVALNGFTPATSAQVFRYSAANLNAIVAQPAQSVAPSDFTATYLANSITLVVIPTSVPLSEQVYLPLVRR